MSRTTKLDPVKQAEAQKEYADGKKHLATTLTKWKPDYLSAEASFSKAARLFKSAGLMDSAVDAWRQAAACMVKLNNRKGAGIALETASRELSMNPAAKEQSSALLEEAADLFSEAEDPVRASDMYLRAGKFLEGFNNDKAAKLYDKACSLFNDDPARDVYAIDPLRKVVLHQLGLGKHASAMRTWDRLSQVYTRLKQPHNNWKIILSRVVLLLAAADPVAAQKEYERNLDYEGFASSPEAAAAEDLLETYRETNADAMKSVLERSCFGFLDHSVTKIARGLPSVLFTGGQVGVKSEDEAATKAVSHAPDNRAAGPGGLREFGVGVAIGRSAGGEIGSVPRDQDDRARRDEERDSAARSALFARPADATGASGGGAGGPSSAAASKARGGAGAPRDSPARTSDVDEQIDDVDYEAAFRAVAGDGDGDGDGDGADQGIEDELSGGGGPSSVAAPAPAPAAPVEEDLGLL